GGARPAARGSVGWLTATRAPSRARVSATSRPIPRLAPVTRATCPLSLGVSMPTPPVWRPWRERGARAGDRRRLSQGEDERGGDGGEGDGGRDGRDRVAAAIRSQEGEPAAVRLAGPHRQGDAAGIEHPPL